MHDAQDVPLPGGSLTEAEQEIGLEGEEQQEPNSTDDHGSPVLLRPSREPRAQFAAREGQVLGHESIQPAPTVGGGQMTEAVATRSRIEALGDEGGQTGRH